MSSYKWIKVSKFPSSQASFSDDEIFSAPHAISFFRPDGLKSQTPFYPIGEVEDFYDPFSKLSLFLAGKVKKEIQQCKTAKKWSSKIEADLLAKILPELKKKFPSCRLDRVILKKVWNKVTHYYEKIQTDQGGFNKEGKLDLSFMVRENLKKALHLPPSLGLPPYHLAHEIAVKISEYFATLEGRCPDLDQLTKMVWAVQKNMLRNLSNFAAKSPYEEHDKLDKLIVKTVLETCSENPCIALRALKKEILNHLKLFEKVHLLIEKNRLSAALSALLANKICFPALFNKKLNALEIKEVETFIDIHIQHHKKSQKLSLDIHYQQIVQLILSLYPIAKNVPKKMANDLLRKRVQEILSGKTSEPSMDSALYVFIHAEIHLMQKNEAACELQSLEKRVIDAYHIACSLPNLNRSLFENFELLIWKKLSEKEPLLETISKDVLLLLEKELGNIILDKPHQTFQNILRRTFLFFKKVGELPFHEKENKAFWLTTRKKSEIWALQNEMVCRWIHFDDESPLLLFLKKEWKKQHSKEEILRRAVKKFPILSAFQPQLSTRLWILQQYFWYSQLSDGTESSYDRFLKKYGKMLKKSAPKQTDNATLKQLKILSDQMLPFTPFQKIAL